MRRLLLLPLALLFGCFRADKVTVSGSPDKPVFDVPLLLTKSIDQVMAMLGKPLLEDAEPTAEDMREGLTEWERSFKNDTTTLFVTYNAQTRQVLQIYITSDHHGLSAYEPLLHLVNIKGNEPGLRVEPQLAPGHPQAYDGVKVSVRQGPSGSSQ